MDGKTKKIIGYTILTALIAAMLVLIVFLTIKLIKPEVQPQSESETKETSNPIEEAPEGMGMNVGSTGIALVSTADTFISTIQPDNNFGNVLAVNVDNNVNPGVESRGLVKFDTSSIPTNATIESATLKIYVMMCGVPASVSVTSTQITSAWDEFAVTWNNKPSSSGGVPNNLSCTSGPVPGAFYYTSDVKGIVQNWVNYSQKNFGFMIMGANAGNWNFSFYTREWNNASQKPQLDISYYESTGTTPDGNQGQNNTGTSGSNISDSNNVGDMNMLTALGQEIQPPIFTHIIKNDEKTDAPISDIVEIKEGDSLEAFGTSVVNAKLKIYIKGIAYDAVADEEGNWSHKFDPSKLDIGEESLVQVQVLTEDGTNSMVVEMFALKGVAGSSVEQSTSENPTFLQNLLGKYIYYLYGILIGLLIAMSVTLFFLIRKKRETEKNNINI